MINGAAVWGVAIVGSFLVGYLLAARRRDGRLDLVRLLREPPPVPPALVWRELRQSGFRALARPDLLFLAISYSLLVALVSIAIAMEVVKHVNV